MSNDHLTPDDRNTYKRNTDAEQIRKTVGIPPWWAREDEFSEQEYPLPNAIVHTQNGDEWGHPGGTNWLAVGNKGSGKSTLALWLAVYLMDKNDETVIWRGAEARSEWLPYKPWTHLYLPAGCDITARWEPEDNTKRGQGEPADLAETVAEVHRYDGLRDLLDQLGPHEFAVVYPDPLFRECNELMDYSTYVQEPIEYVSAPAAEDPKDVTPLIHWWVALGVARLEGWGDLLDWTSLIFDEVADLLPQSARANRNQTYEKLEVMRKVIADSRKYRFSVFCFGQDEANVHEKVRRTFEWRVALPDEDGNPCKIDNDAPPVGFSNIPMIKNFLRYRDAGYGLCWTPSNFTRFTWEDIPDWEEDAERRLKISIAAGDPNRARVTESRGDTGATEAGSADAEGGVRAAKTGEDGPEKVADGGGEFVWGGGDE